MTEEQERWAEALAVRRLHGDRADIFAAERISELAQAGDNLGIARWKEIAHRLSKLATAESVSQ